MIVLGVSSGTSLDAIDVAAARFTEQGPGATMELLGHWEVPWDAGLRAELVAALPPARVDAGTWCRLNTLAGQAFGRAARQGMDLLAREQPGATVDLVSSHGQTMYHWVEAGQARGTLQLGDPAFTHAQCGVPVITGLRAPDIAAGGHGAPLVAVLDWLWLAAPDAAPSVALNIGGIANITVVRSLGDPVAAWDTGPGNCLMDAAVAGRTGGREARDDGGHYAATGTADPAVLGALLAEPYYAAPPPKSTGREYFDAGYAQRVAGARVAQLSMPDLLATLAELTAITVARAIAPLGAARVVVSGGGAHNPHLMARLAAHLTPGTHLLTSDQLGLPVDSKEAYLFALLGYLSATGRPGTAPGEAGLRATGATRPVVLGSLTPPTPVFSPAHAGPHGQLPPLQGLTITTRVATPAHGRPGTPAAPARGTT